MMVLELHFKEQKEDKFMNTRDTLQDSIDQAI